MALLERTLLRSFIQPGTGRLDQGRFVRYVSGMVALGAAILLGNAIAFEKWRYLALLGGVVVSLLWPFEIALGSYALLVPFTAVTALGSKDAGTTLNWVIGALAGMALLGTGIVRKRLSPPPRPALWFSLFMVWALASMVWALRTDASMHLLPTAVSLVLLYLAASCWDVTEKQFSLLTKLIVLGGCAAAAFTVYQYWHGVTWTNFLGTPTRGSLVVQGRETNPNSLGTALLLPFSLAMAWFLSARRSLNSLWGLAAAMVIMGGVFVTMSRGSMVCAGVILAVYFLRLKPKRWRLTIIAAALLATSLTMPGTFFARIKSAAHDQGSGRLYIWTAGLQIVKHHPLLGVGLGNFPVAYADYAGYAHFFLGLEKGAHNAYLEAQAEFGILGLLLLLAALVSHIRAVSRLPLSESSNRVQVLGIECACWAMVVAGLFEGVGWEKTFWLTWTLCLLAVKLGHARKTTATSEQDTSSTAGILASSLQMESARQPELDVMNW